MSWKESKFKVIENTKAETFIIIRNQLANDGIIYAKNVRHIFEDSLNDACEFFETWEEKFDTAEIFHQNMPLIQEKIQKLIKIFKASSIIHDACQMGASSYDIDI